MEFRVKYDLRLLAYRNLYQTLYSNSKFMNEDDPAHIDEFCASMLKSVWSDLSTFTELGAIIKGVIFTRDSHSWRKDKYELKYKGTRKSSRPFNRHEFDAAVNKFCEDMYNMMGIPTIKVTPLEADDILAFLTIMYNKNGKNCIIVSGDSDLHQLATHNGEAGSTLVYDSGSKAKFFIAGDDFSIGEGEISTIASNDIFSVGMNKSTDIRDWLMDAPHVLIDQRRQLLQKILCGDSGDNIPPVATDKKNFTKSMFNKLWDKGVFSHIDNTKESMSSYLVSLSSDDPPKLYVDISSCIGTFNTEHLQQIKESIKRNIDLIWLSPKVFANNELLEPLKEAIKELKKADMNTWRKNYKSFMDKSLFINTKYTYEKYYNQ